jgi:hypothetical protein
VPFALLDDARSYAALQITKVMPESVRPSLDARTPETSFGFRQESWIAFAD